MAPESSNAAVSPPGDDPRLRLVEVLAALSLVSDLARGHPPEEAMRACLLATALARRLGLTDADAADVYYTALLRFVGCTATSHEYAAVFGDDVAARRRGDMLDTTRPQGAMAFLADVTRGGALVDRTRRLVTAAPRAKRTAAQGSRADCEVGAAMAGRFDLDPPVQRALLEMFERWDGRGAPAGIAGEAIALPARIAAVAYVAIMFDRAAGPAAADMVRQWSGRALDPAVASAFLTDPGPLLAEATPDDALPAVVDAEPGPPRMVAERRLDEVCRGFADAVDLKSPFLHGHSAGVAALAVAAAEAIGLPTDQVAAVGRAGLLHDLGRVGVSTAVWEKPGPLSVAEWEQVRLHPYQTERILARSAVLAPVARLAGFHHERLDGSGYHRGAPAGAIDGSARILAAADVYQALTEPRPHRPAFGPDDAARTVRDQPGLDPDAVEAVLEAAGHRRRSVRRTYPARLTEREVQVLRLLVRGRSEKQIARELFIAPSTVHTHVLHVYGKSGVSTRAGVALFAMEHDLIHP